MSIHELPQNSYTDEPVYGAGQLSVSAPFEGENFAGEQKILKEESANNSEESFMLDPNMSPAEIVDLARRHSDRYHAHMNEVGNVANLKEQKAFIQENQGDLNEINAEIAAEHKALEEKFGPEENWPAQARNAANTNRVGWGMAAVAGVGALGGVVASTEANAGGFIDIAVNRTTQGIGIESGAHASRDAIRVDYETKRNQLELNCRARYEQKVLEFKSKEEARNIYYQNEFEKQNIALEDARQKWEITPNHSDRQLAEIELRYKTLNKTTHSRQDAEFKELTRLRDNQLLQINMDGEQQLARLELENNRRVAQNELSRESKHAQATATAEQQVIREGVNKFKNITGQKFPWK